MQVKSNNNIINNLFKWFEVIIGLLIFVTIYLLK